MHHNRTKEILRRRFLEIRREMTFEKVFGLSDRIQKRFLESAYFKNARRLSLYSSFANEVLTDEIFLGALKRGKETFYPKVLKRKRHLDFFRVADLNELSPGAFDIREPEKASEAVGPGGFDLIVVPGVVFDPGGGRVGFGKGYYDRALKGLECEVVALAYESQVLDRKKIPMESHDVRVGAIVTENRIIKIR
ncbi:MAG: 5-formyltetrahydrofolate cyclo-ligase [Thermodesulfobacteriota bacterium]